MKDFTAVRFFYSPSPYSLTEHVCILCCYRLLIFCVKNVCWSLFKLYWLMSSLDGKVSQQSNTQSELVWDMSLIWTGWLSCGNHSPGFSPPVHKHVQLHRSYGVGVCGRAWVRLFALQMRVLVKLAKYIVGDMMTRNTKNWECFRYNNW